MTTKSEPGHHFTSSLEKVFKGERECLHSPQDEVELGEVVLGVLVSPIGRAIYSLLQEANARKSKCVEQLNAEGEETALKYHAYRQGMVCHEDKEKMINMDIRLNRVNTHVNVLLNLLTEYVCEEYPSARVHNVGICLREGWQVVVFKR